MHILLSRVKPQVNCMQLHVAMEDGSRLGGGGLQLKVLSQGLRARGQCNVIFSILATSVQSITL